MKRKMTLKEKRIRKSFRNRIASLREKLDECYRMERKGETIYGISTIAEKKIEICKEIDKLDGMMI